MWGPLLHELTDAQRLAITGALSGPGTLTGPSLQALSFQGSSGVNGTASQRQGLAACVINCLCFLTKGVDPLTITSVGGEGSGLI